MAFDVSRLVDIAGIKTPVIGFYDAPATLPFAPLIKARSCVFSSYRNWLKGHSVLLGKDNYGCSGAGYWLCGVDSIPQKDYAEYLAVKQGYKSSPSVMNGWMQKRLPYKQENSNIIIGPLKGSQQEFLKSVTFYVNPDQLGFLLTGCEYHNADVDTHPVISAFGSGCGQLVAMFEDLNVPKAIIGATDISMRKYLPPEVLALTVTKPMFEQLCALGEDSFLYKPYWRGLKRVRSKTTI